MEDVSDKCWYCKAILPHHRRFGPLLRTAMRYETTKRVFFLALPDGCGEGVSSKCNTSSSLLCILSRWKCSNQGARTYPLDPARFDYVFLLSRWKIKSRRAQLSFGPCLLWVWFFCYHGENAQIKTRVAVLVTRNWENGVFVRLKNLTAFWALCGSNPGSVQCAGPVPQRPPRRGILALAEITG